MSRIALPRMLAGVLGLASACVAPAPEPVTWPTVATVAYAAKVKLGGVALGDIHPELDGSEIVAVGVDGRVVVIHRVRDGWRADVAFKAPGELIAVTCGDLLPDRPGDEILAVGMASGDEESEGPGAVWLLARSPAGGFDARLLLEPGALQHAAAIGDFDPERPGLEALSAGFDLRAHLFEIRDDLTFEHRDAGELPGPAKGACVWDGRAVLTCASGHVVALARGSRGGSETLLEREAGFSRPAAHGDLLVAASDDGTLVARDLAKRGEMRVLHRQNMKARGAYIGELDSDVAGVEVATVGYEGRVLMLRLGAAGPDGRPEVVELAVTGVALHHLAGGDVLPDRPGDELVTVGYSGDVIVLSR
jgi:hypothetical protein